ncbi:hypothetical protein DdX_03083 [Ditylenchus destructor]|uniref:Uncharacterized protein n=1 Tax=Ditylenchus destructor TaxID=166010 RepID=A0AAD4NDY9_9BILA|nr:hypothetical protein DdX_03083 [Ditylenchus destructor]
MERSAVNTAASKNAEYVYGRDYLDHLSLTSGEEAYGSLLSDDSTYFTELGKNMRIVTEIPPLKETVKIIPTTKQHERPSIIPIDSELLGILNKKYRSKGKGPDMSTPNSQPNRIEKIPVAPEYYKQAVSEICRTFVRSFVHEEGSRINKKLLELKVEFLDGTTPTLSARTRSENGTHKNLTNTFLRRNKRIYDNVAAMLKLMNARSKNCYSTQSQLNFFKYPAFTGDGIIVRKRKEVLQHKRYKYANKVLQLIAG